MIPETPPLLQFVKEWRGFPGITNLNEYERPGIVQSLGVSAEVAVLGACVVVFPRIISVVEVLKFAVKVEKGMVVVVETIVVFMYDVMKEVVAVALIVLLGFCKEYALLAVIAVFEGIYRVDCADVLPPMSEAVETLAVGETESASLALVQTGTNTDEVVFRGRSLASSIHGNITSNAFFVVLLIMGSL